MKKRNIKLVFVIILIVLIVLLTVNLSNKNKVVETSSEIISAKKIGYGDSRNLLNPKYWK